jgi:tetratricopeptide (TPR) repeat protein
MKKIILLLFITTSVNVLAQPTKKPATQKQPSQADMNKMMEEAMKAEGMSKEEQEEMKKMMKDVMPALQEHNKTMADYPEFKSNRLLIPKKDPARIAAISKKALSKTEVATYASGLYNKLMAKGNPSETALAKKIIAQSPKASDLGSAAFLCLLQGHPQTAIALYLKAIQLQPNNPNWQNNTAALLTQCGFPELSIPLLGKLDKELPRNSTILNNIGYAWLGLGQADSAKRYFTTALRINPKHPEARAGKGVTDEDAGKKEMANKNYKEAMENAVNPFTDQLLKNNDGADELKKIDLEKIKTTIPYYEYFGEDWINTLPVLSSSVYNYKEDKATKEAYKKMIEQITIKVKTITDKLDDDLDATTKKGEDEFVRIMTEETMKGLNMMSKPAVIGILGNYMVQWQDTHLKETLSLGKWKETQIKKRDADLADIYKKINNTKGATCKQYKYLLDSVENVYMRTVNGRFREFLFRKADELRHWANMYCSWNWYVAGNLKNTILLQDYGFLGLIAETYSSIVLSMEVRQEHCVDRFDEIKKIAASPQLPNFDCRPILSVPAGAEWEELLASSKSFDDNKYGVKKTDEPVPNVSASYGIADLLAEPAIAPFVKTADGSVSPANYVNPDDVESSYYADEKYVPADPETKPIPEEDVYGEKRRTSRMIRELLGDMVQTDCKSLKSSKDALREALARKKEAMRDKIYNQTNQLKKYDKLGNEITEQRIKELVAQAKRTIEKYMTDNNIDNYLDNLDQMMNTLEQLDYLNNPQAMREVEMATKAIAATQQNAWEIKNGPAVLNSIEQNGIQVSISSGLQSPGTFKMPKDLFK